MIVAINIILSVINIIYKFVITEYIKIYIYEYTLETIKYIIYKKC